MGKRDWKELVVGLSWIVQKIVQIDIKSNIKFKTILLKISSYNLIFPFQNLILWTKHLKY